MLMYCCNRLEKDSLPEKLRGKIVLRKDFPDMRYFFFSNAYSRQFFVLNIAYGFKHGVSGRRL